jgi:hypothetical protein
MQFFVKFNLLLILGLFISQVSVAQNDAGYKMSKDDLKKVKALSVNDWKTKDLERDGKLIDINAIAGEAIMFFYTMKIKDKKTNKKSTVHKWKMDMGGQERIFDYQVKGDSIQFVGVKGWNDFKIINMEADRLVVENVIDGHVMRWNMLPRPKVKEEKKKKKK